MIKFLVQKNVIVCLLLIGVCHMYVGSANSTMASYQLASTALAGMTECLAAQSRFNTDETDERYEYDDSSDSDDDDESTSCGNDLHFHVEMFNDFTQMANDMLILFNAYKKGDLYVAGGKSLLPLAAALWVLQDGYRLFNNLKVVIANSTKDEDDEECEELEDTLEDISSSDTASEIKLTKISKTLVCYVLPLLKTVAGMIMAYDSSKESRARTKDMELINYMCIAAIEGCRILSEYLQTERGNVEQYMSIARAVVCITVMLCDSRLLFNRKCVEVTKLERKLAQTTANLNASNAQLGKKEMLLQNSIEQSRRFSDINNSLRTYSDNLDEQNKSLETYGDDAYKKITTVICAIKEQEEENKKLETQLDEQLEKYSTLQKELETLNSSNSEKIKDKQQEYDKQIAGLKAELKKSQSRVAELENEKKRRQEAESTEKTKQQRSVNTDLLKPNKNREKSTKKTQQKTQQKTPKNNTKKKR